MELVLLSTAVEVEIPEEVSGLYTSDIKALLYSTNFCHSTFRHFVILWFSKNLQIGSWHKLDCPPHS